MIEDSYYWKNDLLKLAVKLRNLKYRKNPGEGMLAHFEQTVMLGFYAIRKLAESIKLSDIVVTQQINLIAYPWNGTKNVTNRNAHRVEELYTFVPKQVSRDTIFICNQIIHSYVFMPVLNGNTDTLHVIWFSSDRHCHQYLYEFEIDRIIKLFTRVGRDYPNCGTYNFNPKTGDYGHTQWIGDHDEDGKPRVAIEHYSKI